MKKASKFIQAQNSPNVSVIMGGEFQKSKDFDLQEFILSDSIKITLTFILFIILFGIAFFIAYLKVKQQQILEGTKIVPQAEIKLPK